MYLPQLAEVYGLRPWELQDLRPAELGRFVNDLKKKARGQ